MERGCGDGVGREGRGCGCVWREGRERLWNVWEGV